MNNFNWILSLEDLSRTPCVCCTAISCHRCHPKSQSSEAQISHILSSSFHCKTIRLGCISIFFSINMSAANDKNEMFFKYERCWPGVTIARLYHPMWLLTLGQFTSKLNCHNLWLNIGNQNLHLESGLESNLRTNTKSKKKDAYLANLTGGSILHPILFFLQISSKWKCQQQGKYVRIGGPHCQPILFWKLFDVTYRGSH